jgi:hypothetical protein
MTTFIDIETGNAVEVVYREVAKPAFNIARNVVNETIWKPIHKVVDVTILPILPKNVRSKLDEILDIPEATFSGKLTDKEVLEGLKATAQIGLIPSKMALNLANDTINVLKKDAVLGPFLSKLDQYSGGLLTSAQSLAKTPDDIFNDRNIDVLFIGHRYGVRGDLIDYLTQNNVKIECYGAGWSNGFADVKMMRELSKRAKIILGIGTIAYTKNVYTLKLRDFDAPMSGAMYLTHRNKDLCELYVEGTEIECYDSFEEAKNKIQYYLSNEKERLSIAKNGQNKALSSFSWDKRLKDTFVELGLLNNEI